MAKKYMKLFGIDIDNKVKFDERISNTNLKANKKPSALARLSGFSSLEKWRTSFKEFIESQLSIAH